MSGGIGWIGLGRMGLPMAKRLLATGHDVRAFDISTQAMADFARAGGTVAPSLSAVAAGVEVVITMLPDGAAVRTVMIDHETPVAPAMAAGGLVIDMSSSAPFDTRRLGAALASHDLALADAPVSGGVVKAIDGTLSIMLGGDLAVTARARPLLQPLSAAIFATGALGSGHAMKALNNFVSAAGLIAACEAVRIGSGFGLNPDVVVDVLNASTGRNNATENKLRQHVLSGRFASGFGLALMTKDVGIAADLALQLGLEAPLSREIAALATRAFKRLGPASDHTEIDRHNA